MEELLLDIVLRVSGTKEVSGEEGRGESSRPLIVSTKTFKKWRGIRFWGNTTGGSQTQKEKGSSDAQANRNGHELLWRQVGHSSR